MAEDTFLGKGIHFPLETDGATGRIRMTDGAAGIRESIYLILMTQKTERWLRPDFGSALSSYTFMDTGATMMNIMARELRENIMAQEPRISQVAVHIDAERKPGCLIVGIEYTISAVNTRDNLVFPFYLNLSPEEETDEDRMLQP